MNTAFLVVILALIWAGISGNFTGLNLVFGGLIGGVAVLVLREALASPRTLRRVRRVVSLTLLFVYELMVSAVRVAIVVV
ncbi:Na+/H+ antiporter subunit E, partial [Escherichia coli]